MVFEHGEEMVLKRNLRHVVPLSLERLRLCDHLIFCGPMYCAVQDWFYFLTPAVDEICVTVQMKVILSFKCYKRNFIDATFAVPKRKPGLYGIRTLDLGVLTSTIPVQRSCQLS